ncbi:RNA polymerase sigma factor [Ekhidna sp.]|uniref:RNA polymerase sigma factor n=1 Tax=Ekhidna sp. TaxID=2608089 RepID=UPI003B599DB7
MIDQQNWNRKYIERIYDECYPVISNWIRRNSGSERDAEDVFQDTLVVVYQKFKETSFSLDCKLSTFIFSIAKKLWLNRLRTKGRLVYSDFSIEGTISERDEKQSNSIIEDAEVQVIYKKHFSRLSKECQEILNYFFNGMSMKEIVIKMRYENDGLARKRKFRCKNELVKMVKSDSQYQELLSN